MSVLFFIWTSVNISQVELGKKLNDKPKRKCYLKRLERRWSRRDVLLVFIFVSHEVLQTPGGFRKLVEINVLRRLLEA